MRASSFSLTMKLAEVHSLPGKIGEGTVERIVTEPYLGPPQIQHPRRDEAMQWKRECEALYYGAFRAFARLLTPGGRVVMVWPAWRVGKREQVFLEGIKEIEALGFRVRDPLITPLIPAPREEDGYLAARHSLLYQREDQHVLREIRVFDKV
jgi:tRNA G10  N-methylase Trm11